MNLGDAFWYKSPGVPQHLWVIISHPCADTDRIVAVNATTVRNKPDTGCLLTAADHPGLDHDSFIEYRKERTWEREWLMTRSKPPYRYVDPVEPFNPTVVQRVLDGVNISGQLPVELSDILREQGLI